MKKQTNRTTDYENKKLLILNSQFSIFNSLDDERIIFVPEEEIRAVRSIYSKMEQAKMEFCKIAEGMRQIEREYTLY